MKIAYITPYYPPHVRGGAEISLKILAETLAKEGHQIVIFVPNYQKNDEMEGQNPKIVRIKFGKDTFFSQNNPISVRYFANRILNLGEKFEIIDAYKWFFPAKIVAESLNIPLVLSIRDATPICDFRVDKNPKEYSFFEYFNKRFTTYGNSPRQILNGVAGFFWTRKNLQMISVASCLTFASKALLEIFKKYNACGEVIYSVGISNFKRVDVEIPGINFKKDKIIAYAGRLSHGKGAAFLFEAAKKVVAKSDDIKFVFVGDGELQQKIAGHKFKGKIFCLGKSPHEFVLSLIEKARVAVVPSIIFEAFPRLALESVCLGTPVIGTKIGGIPEAVGKAGIIIEADDIEGFTQAILKICRDENFYLKLKHETRNQANKFNPERITEKIINLYHKVLNS